jgi:uracil permease
MSLGYLGLIIGAICAGLVYVVIAIIVKFAGVNWINKIMPAVVIGPTVAIIGLSLAGNAIGDLTNVNVAGGSVYVALICGLITLFVTMICSTYGKKTISLIPFIIGILAGYLAASLFYLIGDVTDNDALKIINYSSLTSMNTFFSVPDFTFVTAIKGIKELNLPNSLNIKTLYARDSGLSSVNLAPGCLIETIELPDDVQTLNFIDLPLLKESGLIINGGWKNVSTVRISNCPNLTSNFEMIWNWYNNTKEIDYRTVELYGVN